MESRKFKQTRIPCKKSGIVKSKLDDVRKRLLRNNELYIINMGKQIDTILNEGIIYEESLDMKDRHALTMFRNTTGDTVDANKVDVRTDAEIDCSKCTNSNGAPGGCPPWYHDKRCPYRQKYEHGGWDAIIIRD